MRKREGFYANPSSRVEEPVVIETGPPMEGTRATHPAYGQIGVNRVQGLSVLYGSDFLHHNYMVIRVYTSELHRSLSSDWTHEREPIVEVALSEAQWATFVSSPNVGRGTQCTIESIGREQMPRLPDPTSRAEQYSGEIKETLADALRALDGAIKEAEAGKVKASIREALTRARQELASNIPFVAGRFEEHTEEVVEKAKAEIHGYMVATIQRAGLEALTGGNLPLQIDAPDQPALSDLALGDKD